jgi:autotransporter-associated beta strand protein
MSQVYNTITNFNWVCPAGVTNLQVECWGGGGGGGSSLVDTNAGGSANAGGGGGGGGAYAKLNNVPVTPGNSYNITIPAAATPAATGFSNNQRYNGSAVSFTGDGAVTVSANGGQGGQCIIVTDATATSGQAGAGGTAGTGYDVVWAGGDATYWSAGNGGGGGGGAGDLAAGGSPLAANGSFGAGGTGSDPNHKGGDGGAARNGASDGNSASKPGGGGGGAKSTPASPGPSTGGSGGLGQIILTWEIPTITNVVKADNTTNLNLGDSWVGGMAPTPSTIATWDNTVASANTTVLGSDLSWAGIVIADPVGQVTIDAGNTLTLGGVSTNIDMSAATADLALNCGISLGSANVWDVQSGRTLTVGGAVTGPGSLAMQNGGKVVLSSGANDYSGDTKVGTNSTLQLGVANVIPSGGGKGIATVDGALDLSSFSQTLNGLSGAGTVDTVAGGTPMLTLGAGDGAGTFTGVIQNMAGTLSLTKTGTNRQDLVGANTFSGPVQVNQGWLAVGDNNVPLANVPSITVADGATFGAYGTEVDVNVPVTLGAGNPTINIAACVAPLAGGANTTPRPFRLNAGITGTGNVVFKGANPFNWTGFINVNNCTYSGSTLITCMGQLPGIANTNNDNVVVALLGDDALPTNTVVTMDGNIGVGSGRYCDLDLAGYNQTLAGLSNIPHDLRYQRVVNPGAAATLTINNNADYEFSGFMGATSGGSSPGDNLSLVKSGSGTFTLSKANGNTYANGTTINGGTLLVNNLTGSGTGTGDVTVNSGGTLGGTGSITGNVLVNAGGGLAPGASIGTLTVNGALTLSADSTNVFEVDGTTPANDAVVLGSTVSYGGVLKIVPSGSFTIGQTFTLFRGSGATDPSNFASVTSTGSATFSFTNGVLTVVSSGGPSGPATITNSISGNTLTLTWPAGQSWRLLGQTNNLSVGLNPSPSAWFDVPGGTDGSNSITIDHASPAVFYKLVSP